MKPLSTGILSPAAHSILTDRSKLLYFCISRPGWDHSLATIFIPAFYICFWLTGQCPMVETLRRHNFHGGQPSCLAYYRCLITCVDMETHVGGPFAFLCLGAGVQWPTLAVPGTAALWGSSSEAGSLRASAGLARAQGVGGGEDAHTPSCFRAWQLGLASSPNT